MSSSSSASCDFPDCKNPAKILCGNCHQGKYCTNEHQIQNWSNHKASCFPVKLQEIDPSNSGRNYHWVASRDIKQGEIILKENAISFGPMGFENPPNILICLGCCSVIKIPYLCSSCKWPVCDADCEMVREHVQNECMIFTLGQIPPVASASGWKQVYHQILLLRTLRLKKLAPEKWGSLLSIQPKEHNSNDFELLMESIHFIQITCGLGEFGRDEIKRVDGIIRKNAIKETMSKGIVMALHGQGLKIRSLMPIVEKSRLISHSCIPNTKFVVERSLPEDNSVSIYTKTIYSTVGIPLGEVITASYIHPFLGARRSALLAEQGLTCKCLRCTDPTELGTFFSAVKCQECQTGYLLPVNISDEDGPWLCTQANRLFHLQKKSTRDIRKIEENVRQEIKEIRPCPLEKLDQMLKKHSGVTLHPNHFLLHEFKQEVIWEFAATLRSGQRKDNPRLVSYLYKRTIQLTGESIGVLEKILPGWNEYMGSVLYPLAQIKNLLVVRNSPIMGWMAVKPWTLDLLATVSAGKNSLFTARVGTPEQRLCQDLKILEVEILARNGVQESASARANEYGDNSGPRVENLHRDFSETNSIHAPLPEQAHQAQNHNKNEQGLERSMKRNNLEMRKALTIDEAASVLKLSTSELESLCE